MAEFAIASWVLWTFGIAFGASLLLNGGGLCPPINTLRIGHIEGRWVMFATIILAFWLWIAVNPEASASQAGIALPLIYFFTLGPNTLIHRYCQDNGRAIGSWGLTGEARRPNNHSRLLDLLLDIKAERLQAQQALAAQDELLQSLYVIFDPSGTRDEEEK